MIEINAQAGEAVQNFAKRMVELRELTSEDFIAIHNDRKVTVCAGMIPVDFVREWDALRPPSREERTQAAVAALDALGNGDPEVAHGDADAILLSVVPTTVADAFERARARVGFWYS